MGQNYPNPFSGITNLDIRIPMEQPVTLEVMEISGKRVLSKNFGRLSKGEHTLEIEMGDISEGMYLYDIHVGDHRVTRSLLVGKP